MHLQHAGSKSWDISSRNGVVTLLGRNVASLGFSDCWQFFLSHSSNKEGELMLKHVSVIGPLIWTILIKHYIFMLS